MREKLRRAGIPTKSIGIDEISIRKGQLPDRGSAIWRGAALWFGGPTVQNRAYSSSMIGSDPRKSKQYGLALMDMWKPFETLRVDIRRRLLSFTISFHVLRHLNEAMDKVARASITGSPVTIVNSSRARNTPFSPTVRIFQRMGEKP